MESDKVKLDVSRLYTKSEAANKLSISRPTLDVKIKSKEVLAVKVNGAILVYI
jgi:predicted DNA-binding protein (UPF0251 family)